MCEFISWVELPGKTKAKPKVLFLTHDLIFNTLMGELLQKWSGSNEDYTGHGAIRFFYGLEQDEGTNRECSNFYTPDKFPQAIVKAIKGGEMRGLGTAPQLLTEPARAAYEKVERQAWAEYQKASQPDWGEYQKARQQAFWDLFAQSENRNPEWR